MKKLNLILLLLFISFSSFSQGVAKLRTESISIKFQNDNGTWKDWTDWKNADVLAIMDEDGKKLTLYTDPKEVYEIIKMTQEITDEGENILKMFCVDNDGIECNIRLQHNNGENLQLYIKYSNVIIAYNVKYLK
ncbi:hypothetical protein [Gillisia sp. Hel_I_29]|uniref:hypothetical protein n=1 Tax=Gillisia sp. Hel_I_29 TaxID=1249975 RepID=UPI0005578D5E|nr:hypothetical protein [Gillisia sp. Hel_I_29]